MKMKVGAILFMLGIMAADSTWLIVPIALIGAGVWLMKGALYG